MDDYPKIERVVDAVNDLVEFQGKIYNRVKRSARVGELIEATDPRNSSWLSSWLINEVGVVTEKSPDSDRVRGLRAVSWVSRSQYNVLVPYDDLRFATKTPGVTFSKNGRLRTLRTLCYKLYTLVLVHDQPLSMQTLTIMENAQQDIMQDAKRFLDVIEETISLLEGMEDE